VDAVTSANAIEYFRGGIGYFLPATVRGVMEIMLYYGVTTEGKQVMVTGRNDITGKPFAIILGGRAGAAFGPGLGNASVTWCNRYTPANELLAAAERADVIVSCVGADPKHLGRDYLIPGEAVKEDAAIFDVALRRDPAGRLVGDIEPKAATRAALITPVPGGVGPMTVTALMQNVLDAARYACGKSTD
jgi:5,10-methylene-tetrahydrofolate dehydrogenase/methenyl tetrahydrofolate cyclohydrolase